MKISNLKKYILFIVISFIAVIGTVAAETKNIDPTFNGSPVVLSKNDYLGLKCEAQGELNALSVDDNTYNVSIRFDKMPKKSGTDTVVCTWSGRGAVGHSDESGQRTYILNYNIQVPGEITIPINGTVKDNIQVDVLSKFQKMYDLKNVNIKSINKTKHAEYLDWSGCEGGAFCVVSPTDSALNKHETLEAQAVFKYTADGYTGEQTVTVNFKISYTGGIRLYPGGSTCGINTAQFKLTTFSNYTYWESTVAGNVDLPSDCKPNVINRNSNVDKTTDALEFKGWVRVPDANITNKDYQLIGACEGAITGSVPATDGGSYVSCFSYKSGVQIVFDTTSSDMPANSQCRQTGNGTFFCQASGNFTLPQLTQKDTVMGNRKKFLGWTKDNRGSVLSPGTSVSTGDYATYYAKYETVTKEVDRYKSVYVGQSSFLIPQGTLTNCSVASNPYLTAKPQNGQCLVHGESATPEGEYVDVSVTISEEGATRNVTYKFEVRNAGANSEGSSGTFAIDVDAKIVSGENNGYALNDFDHEMCSTVVISKDNTTAGGVSEINDSLTSNNYKSECINEQTGAKTGVKYFTLCMDPGRVGPEGDRYDIQERVSQESELGKMIGMIIDHLNTYSSKESFDNQNDPVRIAAHVAIRTVVLINGYSGVTQTEDAVYQEHYEPYVNLATALKAIYARYKNQDGNVPKKGDSNYETYYAEVQSAVNTFGISDPTARNYLYTMFADYLNYDFGEGGAFQRTIDEKNVQLTGSNSYTVTYNGTITLPSKTTLASPPLGSTYTYLTKPGVTGTVKLDEDPSLSTTDQKVYDYEVVITVSDAANVHIPENHEEELEYSLTLSYSGGFDYSGVRLAKPLNNFSKQRMIVFDLNSYETKIYFNINGDATICKDVPSLDYSKCTSSSSCAGFNAGLFKASGCCSEILDEASNAYVVNNICNGECAVSTMSNVCSYNPGYTGSVDLYEVKEGAYYSEESGEYTDAIGTCVVNVKGNYAYDYEKHRTGPTSSSDKYSRYGESTGNEESSNYFKYDERGNSINVATYQSNRYCQVTCREDWSFTMGAFGNFVGKNAVLAGTFFQNHDNDIFIEGGRTCYTTYLDYDIFMNDLVQRSVDLVDAYNLYAEWSHNWSDIDRQEQEETYMNHSNTAFVWTGSTHSSQSGNERCLEETEYKVCDEWNDPDDPSKCTHKGYHGNYTCTKTYSASEYGYYNLSLDHEFFYDKENEGEFKRFDDQQTDNKSTPRGSVPTQNKLPNKNGFDQEYQQSPQGEDECGWTSHTSGDNINGHKITYSTQYGDENHGQNCWRSDDDAAREKEFMRLKGIMQEESNGKMTEAYGTMTGKYNEIFDLYQQFWNCQHFELNNGSDDANGKANNPQTKAKFAGKERPFEQILTMFDPYVSYDYDEDVYMTILQDDNILIEYTALNDNFFKAAGISEGFDKSTNVQVPAKVGFTDRCVLGVDGDSSNCQKTEPIDVQLSRNKLDFAYYKPNGPWTDDELVKTYGEGTEIHSGSPITSYTDPNTKEKIVTLCTIGLADLGTGTTYDKYGEPSPVSLKGQDPHWTGGKCYEFTVFYTEAHYIKTSIVNSSFYRNKGIWYTGPNDTREHGETLEEAWDNASKRPDGPTYSDRSEEAKARWSVFVGTKKDDNVINGNLNIFPVSMTTARNLYQYTYEFTQIGSYTDGRLGRVMGDAASLIPQNQRTCFYEVVENICLCCGDPIVSYASADIPTAEQFVNSTGYDYDFNQADNYDKAKGTLGYNTSTVALSDLDGATDRKLGNNWTDKGVFYYGGSKLNTNKGQVALEEIQEQGEEVYMNAGSSAPEYSFELRPATLAAIRNYNDMYGYEVNFDNLTLYGRASIQPLGACSNPASCKWFASSSEETEDMNNYIANFGHYGSNFLEKFDEILGVDGGASENNLSNTARNLDVCEVVRSDASAAKTALRNQIDSGKCRWIDYIEVADNVQNLWDNAPSTQYYRLAFK